MTKTTLAILTTLCAIVLLCPTETKAQRNINERIDTLMAQSSSICFSAEGLPLMNELEELSQIAENDRAHVRALECKACIYINEDMHHELQAFCDSIDTHTNLQQTNPYVYFYIAYTHGISLIRQSKYHLAINTAQRMYDYGKQRLESSKNNPDAYLKNVEIYVQGIDILANAYMEIDQPEAAMEFCTESRDLCLSLDQDQISNNMLSASYTRLCAADEIYERTDGAKLLEHIESFKSDLDLWISHSPDSAYTAAIVPYYLCTIEHLASAAYIQLGDMAKVKQHYETFMDLTQKHDMAQNMSVNYFSANIIYHKAMGDYATSEAYTDSLLKYYEDNDMKSGLLNTLRTKLELNHIRHNYEHDFDIAHSLIAVSDSINRFRMTTSIQEMSTLMGMDKLQIETQQLKARHQFMVMMFVIGTLVALLLIGGVWLGLKRQQDKERNKMLSEQNERLETEVAKQTKELREKNDDITASINYAKRIQTAMLPDVEAFAAGHLDGAFALFRPCEIVSGDFYWTHRRDNLLTFVCADCTGHGVPGGFLSMIGSTLLSEIFAQGEVPSPGEALERLDAELMAALDKRGDTTVQDGMDLTMVTYDAEAQTISFAAARRPVFIVHDGELTEHKGTKRSIGDRDETSHALTFETTTMSVAKGDTIYMCSDGIADQFGGQTTELPKGKRLKSGGLKRLLLETSALPIGDQHAKMSAFFDEWKGTCYQVDDVTMIGIRV